MSWFFKQCFTVFFTSSVLASHLLSHLLPVLKQHLGSSRFKTDNLCGRSNEMMVERKGHRLLWTGNRGKVIKWCSVSNLQRTSLQGTQRPCITHTKNSMNHFKDISLINLPSGCPLCYCLPLI